MKTEEIKKMFPAGTRIKLIHMDDIQAVPDGTSGTVDFIDDAGQIHMKWDNGRGLALVYGVDKFKVIPVCPICHKEYDEHPAISRKDNITQICSLCGFKEAIFSFKNSFK